jgi:NhaP-type Na+/H+ or K+/H+ antiporter
MEFLFEIVVQFLGEFLLQLMIELMIDLGLHSMDSSVKKSRNPVSSGIGYVLWGAIAGGISLLLFPTSFIHNNELKLANLCITPLILGGCMMLIGKSRVEKHKPIIGLDSFLYGFLFAFSMSLIRYVWAA